MGKLSEVSTAHEVTYDEVIGLTGNRKMSGQLMNVPMTGLQGNCKRYGQLMKLHMTGL